MGLSIHDIDKSIKGLCIDLDDTIYNYNDSHKIAIKKVYESLDWVYSFEEFYKEYREARDEVTQSLAPLATCRSRYLAFLKMCELRNIPDAYLLADILDEKYWSSLCLIIKPYEEILVFLKEVKKRGIKVAIVTDMTTKIQIQKIKSLNISNFIDFLITSEDVGMEKPHPEIFKIALAKLNLPSDQCIMIGDSFEKDIRGAESIGMKAIHFKGFHDD